MKRLAREYATLIFVGGSIYTLLEILFRGHSHWTMFLTGGVCFMLCGLVNERFGWDLPLPLQMAICTMAITTVELLAGCILNIWLGLGVWDYSALPFNLLGQICPQFAGLWFLLSPVAIVLDDYMRYWLFGEDKPRYTWRWVNE